MRKFTIALSAFVLLASSAMAANYDLDQKIYEALYVRSVATKQFFLPKQAEKLAAIKQYMRDGGSAAKVYMDIIANSKFGITTNHVHLLQWLFANGLDVNHKFCDNKKCGYNVLMAQAPDEYNTTMYFLMKSGIDLNAEDDNGNNVVHYLNNTDAKKILAFLSDRVDINKRNRDGQTPLMLAIDGNILLDLGADPNIQDNAGRTAAMLKVGSNIFARLVKVTDVNIKDNDGKTLLSYVIEKNRNDYDSVKKLIDRGLDVNIDGPAVYSSLNNPKIQRLLIENGLILGNDNGKNPISEILQSRDFDQEQKFKIIKNYVAHGVDINDKGNNNMPPVLAAKDDVEVLKFLQENGADMNALTNSNITILSEYIRNSRNFDIETFRALASLDFDMNFTDGSGYNYIQYAIYYGPKDTETLKETIRILAQKGCDVNYFAPNRESPLRTAKNHNQDVFDLLLELGADINAKDQQGFSMYTIATYSHDVAGMEFLKSRGAKDDTKSGGHGGLWTALLLLAAVAGVLFVKREKIKELIKRKS